MRILVTGASGFIGSGLVATLSEQGHEVCALMRPTASNEFLKGVKFTRLTGDLLEPESLLRACTNIDAIIHCAGLTAAKNREEYFKFNAEGTKNLASAAIQSQSVKRLIYVSSQAAAGPSAGLSPKTEKEPDHPVSMYGESKLRAELYLDETREQLPFIVIRPPIVYGPRDRNVFTLFKTIARQWMPLLSAKSPTGHKYYSAIHVDDLIQALIRGLDASGELFKNGERFFVNDGQIYTYERIMTVIAEELQVKPIKFKIPNALISALAAGGTLLGRLTQKNMVLNLDKLKEMVPDYWICSSQKAYELLEFKPKYTLESGIPQTVAWYKVHGWL